MSYPVANVGTVHKSSSGTGWTVTLPGGLSDGDRMLLVMVGASGGGTFSTPSGWSQLLAGRTAFSNWLQVFSRTYAVGDANPSGTYSSGQRRMGVVIAFPAAAAIDTFDVYGFDEGNGAQISEHPGRDLDDVDDFYSTIVSIFYGYNTGNFSGLKAGETEGHEVLVDDLFTDIGFLITAGPQRGRGTAPSPTALSTPAYPVSAMIQIPAASQPEYIASQPQTAAASIVASKTRRRRPRREYLWVRDLAGEQIGVIR